MNTDINIIADCLKGNQVAFKQLYEKYVSYCYGICIRYSISQADIKDVVQIIFSQAFHSLGNYDSDKSQFKTWFTRVCINNILSYRKKQARSIQTQEMNDYSESSISYSENYIEQNIDKEYLLDLLKQMPSNYQLVFNLFIIDGYSHEEISQKLNISIASSRVTLNRARGWVKKNYTNHLRT